MILKSCITNILECIEGHFGRNCNRSCDGCISNRCQATNGLCYNDTGCEPGYYFEEYCNKSTYTTGSYFVFSATFFIVNIDSYYVEWLCL